MLMEVTADTYRDFYKEKRRQKYLEERSASNGDISIDMLTTDTFNGVDILADSKEAVDELAIRDVLVDKLKDCLSLLTDDELALSRRSKEGRFYLI